MPAALLALLAGYVYADAGPRLDHRGQPFLLVAPLFEQLVVTRQGPASPGLLGELAVGMPLGDEGGNLLVGARAGAGSRLRDGSFRRLVAPSLAYRRYAGGDEPWKTFFDAGVLLRIAPALAPVVRLGAGVQLDVSEHAGLFLGGGIGLGGAEGLHLHGDVALGVQVRFGSAGQE